MRTGAIDFGNPVSEHPLNRGLVGWWLATPQSPGWGGARLLDLRNRTNGTLTNGAAYVGARGRLGGGGALRCSNDAAGVNEAAPDLLKLSLPIHLSFWHRSVGTPTGESLFCGVTYTSTVVSPFIAYGVYITAGRFWFLGNNNGTFFQVDSGVSALQSQWTHVAAEYTSSALRIYINGREVASGVASRTGPTYLSSRLCIGNYLDLARNPNMEFDSGRIANTTLGEAGIADLYLDSLQGHPQTLRRLRRVTFGFLGGGGGGADVSLSGTAAGETEVTGSFGVVRALAGAIAGEATAAANLSVTRGLAGASAGSAALSGSLAVQRGLAGQSQGQTALVGTLAIQRLLAGLAAGQATVTGTLQTGAPGVPLRRFTITWQRTNLAVVPWRRTNTATIPWEV